MPLHLLKLCVGCPSIEDLQERQAARLAAARKRKQTPELVHTTRMVPRRSQEIVEGGSLYWVIKGFIQVRQRITDIQPFTDGEGIRRCHLVLDPVLVCVAPRPHRAFQGWRYFPAESAPADLAGGASDAGDMPADMRQELAELGLL